ncbi:MAG: Tad domain-containing protein [Bdellovibrio sp.]|nr:Tad domain-containing protein [Bdellovibrio sp.]
MFNNRSTLVQRLSNRKGQVALFIALIFQILFLFFAMVINVGLLVHHKINLQNSVDLAAYYGAMKQAENMNAIGHINYQIRQSWKLLAWRYRMIGTAGDFSEHPLNKVGKALNVRPGSSDSDDINPEAKDFYDAPSFCATYVPFKPMPSGENTCRDLKGKSGVKLFNAPGIMAGFQIFSHKIASVTETMKAAIKERCVYFGAYNYKLLGQYVVAFNIDQGDRMLLIAALSRSMSKNTEDFYDLDGDSVRTGIEATLKNNLTTAQNNDKLKIKIYNSLGADGCNNPSTDEMPAKWLVPIRISPAFNYIDTKCDPKEIQRIPKELAQPKESWPEEVKNNPGHALYKDIQMLSNFVGLRQKIDDPYNFSLGVEKNPWCMAYVGVSATSQPTIPFSPFGSVTLHARAYFKPFGGRIGPWYEANWPSGSDKSSGGGKIDKNVPPRIADTANIGEVRDPTRAANFSRFVGDLYGMKSRNVLYQYGKAIFRLDPDWDGGPDGAITRMNGDNTSYVDTAPNFSHWDQLPFEFTQKGTGNGDLLAWSEQTKGPSRFRNLELTAILPDQFDMAYYSIEPDFYHKYYTRIKNSFIPKVSAGFDKEVRPDIGYHKDYNQGGNNLNEFSVKDQYKVLTNNDERDLRMEYDSKLTYISKDWKHVLTGWADKGLLDYSLDTNRLGKCTIEPIYNQGRPSPATAGNCIVGGTTGFAVKMISSDYLNTQMQLGGENSGKAQIKNLPPEDF